MVLVRKRYDLLDKIEERATQLWPMWSFIVVQLRRQVTQSHRGGQSSYAAVLALPGDRMEVEKPIALPNCGVSLIAEQGVNIRCTDATCPHRQTVLDAAAAKKVSQHDCIVKLWPYAHSTAYYEEVLVGLACADKASVGIIVSTTAHPGHWVTCAKDFRQQRSYLLAGGLPTVLRMA